MFARSVSFASQLLHRKSKTLLQLPLAGISSSGGKFSSNTTPGVDSHFSYNPNSPVWSCNEWDPLKEVIIGRPDNAVIPVPTPEVKACLSPKLWGFFEEHHNKYWVDVIPDHWKRLIAEVDAFVKLCESLGVKVVRPNDMDHGKTYVTPFNQSKGFYSAMPRDILMVVGDEIIEACMTWRCRYFEIYAYRHLVKDYWRRGARWTSVPKSSAAEELFREKKGKDDFVTTEFEPTLDAADFLRAGRDVFGQRSQVTNREGIEWLRRHLATRGIRVHEVNFSDPRPMHVDSTMQLVKPGIVLRNPDRPLVQEEFFTKSGWKFVDVPRPNMPKDFPLYLSSEWIGMNTLMFDPDHVFVEKTEPGIIKMYESIGVKAIPLSIRHMNSIGGGFHCWTCDIRREGKMESYFI